MDYKTLKLSSFGQVGLITINRPEALNALNSQFFSELMDYLDYVVADDPFQVLVITGEGKAFAAGADIAEMVNLDPSGARRFSEKGQQILLMLENLPIPVIAAVNGYALGGGCELAMACDFRLASEKAVFGQPEVNLGLIPGYAGTQRLYRQVGIGTAMKWILTGDNASAEEALRLGLVQGVYPHDQFMDEVMKMAAKIASRGPKAVRYAKLVIRRGGNIPFEKALDLEKEYFSELVTDEGHEGMMAFLEKRKPQW